MIEYIQAKKIVAAVVIRSERNKLSLLTQDNKHDKIPSTKVLFCFPGFATLPIEHAPILASLKDYVKQRQEEAASIPLQELWEVIVEDNVNTLWSLNEIAELYYGDTAQTEHLSIIHRALASDNTWFIRKGDHYKARPPDQVKDILTRRRTEKLRSQERTVIGNWLKDIWLQGNSKQYALPEGYEDAAKRYLTWLKDVALNGTDSPRFKEISELLKSIDIWRKDTPFRILVKAGVWSEHENLLLHRFRITPEFSPEIEEEAKNAAARLNEILLQPERIDLRNHHCFSIDDEDTTEIDDALSIETVPEGYLIGIHIADASSFISADSPLDLEARDRATAIYLPTGKIRMIPAALGDNACSLVCGQERPAVSFLITFNNSFEMVETQIALSVIKVQKRYTYDQADEILHHYQPLLDICNTLRAAREKRGAVTLPFPRASIKVDKNFNVYLELEKPGGPSQIVVSELMILANRLAGELFHGKNAPAYFRSQAPPDKEIPQKNDYTPDELYRLRRHLRKGELSLDPASHSGLGLDAYVQVTSPIRRYVDLLMQRQLKSLLRSDSLFYQREELEALLPSLKEALSQAEQIERDQKAYWTMKFLETKRWEQFDAVILQNLPDKHIIILPEVAWETDCPLLRGQKLSPGDRIKVKIETVWPREHLVRVSPVEAVSVSGQ